jgi:rhodanese-related sulfurtransferase
MTKVKFLSLIVFASIFLSGCLKDNPIETLKDMQDSAELLVYFETNGDYINSTSKMPSFVKASEVYSNLNKYLILDIRSKEKFRDGHIEGAINIEMKDLFDFVSRMSDSLYQKIVIVSSTGQSASYATSLLRLAGFDKVYSLQWGMASWNLQFANEWYRLVKNSFLVGRYTFQNYPKPGYSELPKVELGNGTTPELVKARVKKLLEEGFEKVRIDIDEIMKTYNNQNGTLSYFVICYAPTRLYNIRDNGHPPTSVRYQPYEDLKSTTYLQTLPPDKPIAVYEDTGEISAYVVAYLKMLGYNAYSINLGANGMIGEDQSTGTRIIRLKSSDIMNYPFVTGE